MKKLLVALVVLAASVGGWPDGTAKAEPNEGSTPVVADAQRRITAGGLHTCAILDTGQVQCWGQNDNGQLGNGTTSVRTRPQLVSGITTAIGISGGATHTCALVHDGSVRCWGNNGNGQLGNGATSPPAPPVLSPVEVTDVDDATAIASGGFHTCALRAAGTVSCWGHNGSGQLGDGSGLGTSYVPVTVRWDDDSDATSPAVPLSGVTAITAGEYHSCALLGASGEVLCWGHNGFGQLGDGSTVERGTAVKVQDLPDDDEHAHPPHKAVAITAGEGHTCAVLDDNTARCWGHNFYGQLGNNAPFPDPEDPAAADDADSHVPVTVVHDSDPSILDEEIEPVVGIVSISAGQFHTCAALVTGGAMCWGQNGRGQLGDNNPLDGDHPKNKNRAVVVSGLAPARAVTAGGFHTCALLLTDSMSCWGYNFYGQLGHHREQVLEPETVTALSGAATVATGDDHACALTTGADPIEQPVCWGNNANGELGAALVPSPANSTIPVKVAGITDTGVVGEDTAADRVKHLSAGNEHACALPSPIGTAMCWGRNTDGELGNGTTTSSPQPVAVSGLSSVTQISASGGPSGPTELGHTCARTTAGSGSAWCWGDNTFGQLGDETTGTDRLSPVRVRSDHDDDHLNVPPPALTPPVDLTGVVEVAAGGLHSCALLTSGRVRCWGHNANGQLGDGTTGDRAYAVTVDTDEEEPDEDETEDKHFVPLEGITAIAAGASHTCAIKSDNTVWCWGLNSSGQLGDGTFAPSDVPVEVTGLDLLLPLAITAGDNHTCLRVKSARLGTTNSISIVCWGANNRGQLGDGSTSASAEPVHPSNLDFPSGDAAGTDLVKAIGAGRNNTCAALIDLTVSCWGDNTHGQVGDGVGQRSLTPLAVENLGSVGGNAIPAPVDDTATAAAPPPALPTVVAVLANDVDDDGDALSVASVTDPPRGLATTDGSTVTYTPDANFCSDDPTSNVDTFQYAATDGVATVPATVTVTVECPNTAPDAADDAATTAEGTAKSIAVVANDTDVNGDPVSVAPGSVSDPANGSVALDPGNGSITYTPDGDFHGVDTFTYRATDGTAESAPATVTVTVTNVNDAPVAVDDAASTVEDTPTTIAVVANDTDIDGPSIAISAVSDPPHGAAHASSPTEISYTPVSDHCGSDTFTYTISDGALSDTATVTVTITCANDGPDAVNDASTTSEDTSVVIEVLGNDTDPEGDALTVTNVADAPHGTTSINGGQTITYAPDANFCGADSFSYTASDGSGTDSALVVPVVVLCTNDAPDAVDDAAAVAEDGSVALEVLSNDHDVDGDDLVVASVGPAAHGATTVVSNTVVGYEPIGDYCGPDEFTYTVRDPSGVTDTATVTVDVTCVDDAPSVAAIADRVTPWKETVTVPLSVTDADSGDTATWALVAAPAGASLVEGPPGHHSVVWTPARNQIATHPVTVRVTDSAGRTDDESFTVAVTKRAAVLTWVGPTSGQYSDAVPAAARLGDPDGTPLAGVGVTLKVGTRTRSGTTDAAGVATAPITIGDPPGSSNASAHFASDDGYHAASTSTPFVISKERVVTAFTGPFLTTTSASSSTAQLVATVAEEADGSVGSGIGTATVTFREPGGAVLCTAGVTVNVPGAGTATCTTSALPVGARAVVVETNAAAYEGPVDVGAFAIAPTTSGTSAGGGAVASPGGSDRFAFTATPARKAAPTGAAVHVIRTATTATVVQTLSLSGLTRSCTSGKTKTCTATLDTGATTLLTVDLAGGAVSAPSPGGAAKITAVDVSEPDGAGSDRYAIAIGSPPGYTLGSPAAPPVISSGNVKLS